MSSSNKRLNINYLHRFAQIGIKYYASFLHVFFCANGINRQDIKGRGLEHCAASPRLQYTHNLIATTSRFLYLRHRCSVANSDCQSSRKMRRMFLVFDRWRYGIL